MIWIVKYGGIQQKLENKGVDCMFVGYGEDHSGEVYRMFNINLGKITMSRDVKWLNLP